MIRITTVLCFLVSCFITTAQNVFLLEEGNLVVEGNTHLVIDNTNLVNHGSLDAGTGTVIMTGEITTIEGVSETTFYNLVLDNELQLAQDISVENRLEFKKGMLDLQDSDLNMKSKAIFSNADETHYVKTSGNGVLLREVGNQEVFFPTGNSTFNPAYLQNNETTEIFSVRVEDTNVEGTVNRYWTIEQKSLGLTDYDLKVLWEHPATSPDFDPENCSIQDVNNNSIAEASVAQMDNYYDAFDYLKTSGMSTSSTFTVANSIVLPTESAEIFEVNIYPNPATNFIQVDLPKEQATSLEMIDVQGRVVLTQQIEHNSSIKVDHLQAGTYILRLVQDEHIYTTTIIKQ